LFRSNELILFFAPSVIFWFHWYCSRFAIYLILLFRIVTVAERQRSVFSRCYAYGVASVFFFHIVINICMTIGLAPVIEFLFPSLVMANLVTDIYYSFVYSYPLDGSSNGVEVRGRPPP
jgi:hypothetical protein